MASEPVVYPPVTARRGFTPVVGGFLVVEMPGEIMRCRIARVISDDLVMICVDDVPMTRSHLFRKDDIVGVRRRERDGRDVWEALSDRDFIAGRSPNEIQPPEPEKIEPPTKVARKKVVK